MSMGLTPRQAELFAFLESCARAGRVPPTVAEMCSHLKMQSKSGVHRLICALEERGLIRRLTHRARAIQIVKQDKADTGFIVDPIPEVRRAIEQYAAEQHVSMQTAVEEACRAYFVEAAAQ